MASKSSNAPDVPGAVISSNFDRRVHVVGGCRESRISPEDNRNGSDRRWISSSIRNGSENLFLRGNSLSWAPFETGSQLSQFAKEAFSRSVLPSIHLPASVTVIGDHLQPAVELIRLADFLASECIRILEKIQTAKRKFWLAESEFFIACEVLTTFNKPFKSEFSHCLLPSRSRAEALTLH
jgi:hypothetical protein